MTEILTLLSPHCQGIAPDILQDFVSRMDQEYFRRFTPDVIGQHIRLAAQLTPDHPCHLSITGQPDQHFELTLVAYDYFSEFAIICGLLSAFGLNIEEGQIYTFVESAPPAARTALGGSSRVKPKSRPGLTRKKSSTCSGCSRGTAFHSVLRIMGASVRSSAG